MSRPLVLGLTGAAIVGAAIALTYFVDSESGEEVAAVLTTPDRSDPASPAATETQPSAAKPESVSTPVKPEPMQDADKTVQQPPTFDVVRVNPRGDAVIAGRASPNAKVIVRDGKTPIGQAKADARGEWVVVPDQPLAKGSRELTLSATSGDGIATRGDKNVVIVVPGRETTHGRQNSEEGEPNPQATPGAFAVLVPREGKGGSIVIQKPGHAVTDKPGHAITDKPGHAVTDKPGHAITDKPGRAITDKPGRAITDNVHRPKRDSRQALSKPLTKDGKGGMPDKAQVVRPVSIDAVDYDEAGNVTISGSAAPKAPLSVYIDNRHAASGVSDEQGRWRVVPGGALVPGIYTLRVDHLGLDGVVISRAETRFTRAKPVNAMPDDAVVFVEPGNSLWRIARRVYGSGIQYSVIFDANRDQIRDPDLIYPGQVFFVPHVN